MCEPSICDYFVLLKKLRIISRFILINFEHRFVQPFQKFKSELIKKKVQH